MVRKSLVMGGGGVAGVAWQTGLVAGLVEGGVDLAGADEVVGTSAGAVVGSWICNGRDFSAEASGRASAPDPGGTGGWDPSILDPGILAQIFAAWTRDETLGPEVGREVGALALRAPTMPEDQWVRAIGESVGDGPWPSRLRVTAVDASNGAFRSFDASSGAPHGRAVAASCTVPGLFPPVTIADTPYIDGGVRSGTNADLVGESQPDVVLIIAPMVERFPAIGSLMGKILAREVTALRASGIEVTVITPSDEEFDAMGPNAMALEQRGPTVEAGRRRGLQEARSPELKAWR